MSVEVEQTMIINLTVLQNIEKLNLKNVKHFEEHCQKGAKRA